MSESLPEEDMAKLGLPTAFRASAASAPRSSRTAAARQQQQQRMRRRLTAKVYTIEQKKKIKKNFFFSYILFAEYVLNNFRLLDGISYHNFGLVKRSAMNL
jgi:hypothetical protein